MGSGIAHLESGSTSARLDTVWKTCFVPMKWESWDPDVKEMINVSGPLQVGTTFTFMLKNGSSFESRILDVLEEESRKSLIFSSSLLCGAIELRGEIEMTEENMRTNIQYAFSTHGCCAGFVSLNSNVQREIANGVRVGLANIIRISEEAEGASTTTVG